MNLLRDTYGAAHQSLDFQQASQSAVETINGWVADLTERTIEYLVPPGAIDGETRLVLVNALYFKGAWSMPFDPKYTKRRQFVGNDGKKRSVPSMWRMGEVGVAMVEGSVAVELPYLCDRFAMLLVLPPENVPLQAFEEQLDGPMFQRLVDGLVSRRAGIWLPRFTIAPGQSLELQAPLTKLGMGLAFSQDADFSGISSTRLHIDEIYHAATIIVEERGTEAAAATAAVVARPSAPPEFAFDRPFVFAVRDVQTGTIMLLGHVVNP